LPARTHLEDFWSSLKLWLKIETSLCKSQGTYIFFSLTGIKTEKEKKNKQKSIITENVNDIKISMFTITQPQEYPASNAPLYPFPIPSQYPLGRNLILFSVKSQTPCFDFLSSYKSLHSILARGPRDSWVGQWHLTASGSTSGKCPGHFPVIPKANQSPEGLPQSRQESVIHS
jgi:hypothetical protein